ncbi:MAG: TIM barrel protein [Anaerolineae bacterium]|nr:TIM barrel protein [Anaerolineae bacterium]
MSKVKIGCGQITWIEFTPEGIKFKATEDEMLRQISAAGYEGVPASPRDDQPAQTVIDQLAGYGLKPAPSYLGAAFWDKAQEASILEQARKLAAFMRDCGCTEVYVAANGFDQYVTASGKTRNQVAGHVSVQDMMTDAEFDQFAKTLNKVGEITLAQGVKSCFHNHVGSMIETRAEIDRLFSMVDPDVVFHGPDIGHLAWAGVDAVQYCRDYAGQIKTMHVKDVNGDVLAAGQGQDWDYATYSKKGIWTELGQGCLDIAAIVDILKGAGFAGWLIVETDVTQLPTAFESAVVSRNYLKSIDL